MQKKRVRDKVESVAQINVNGISLPLRADWRCDKINKSYQTGTRRFSFGKAVLIRINLRVEIVRDMVMNGHFKYLRKVAEKGDWSVVANRGAFAFFENRNNCSLFPKCGKILLR
jgi:hypothetical protein